MSKSTAKSPPPSVVRCAVYTRKSTEEGLQQDFNTLDAQRESGEAYIAAQKHEGWVCLPDRYDDGGFTGGNLDRPAVKRLFADIEAHRIDLIVVNRVDRLSRSLLDFSRIMEIFDKHNVAFVSVTQQFNTATSMGRLMLNVLLSFAQFEREIISERTREKIAAARRKGKWGGGHHVLGYDVQRLPGGSKLIVNEDEAQRVRAIFQLYLQYAALMPVVHELERRGWSTKSWVTSNEQQRGGRPFDKGSLFYLLTNPVYLGKVRYKDEIHPGEHPGIVDERLWKRVQAQLQHNGRSGGGAQKNKYGALLRELIRCKPCNAAMTHTTTGSRNRRYRYYVCQQAQKRGWKTCPSKSIPALEIERFVVNQIKAIGNDPMLLTETLRQAQERAATTLVHLRADEKFAIREMGKQTQRLQSLVVAGAADVTADALALVQERLAGAEQRLAAIRGEITSLEQGIVKEEEVVAALKSFDPLWESLSPREQARIVRLLVERVDYDGKNEAVTVTFRETGIRTLAQEQQETAA